MEDGFWFFIILQFAALGPFAHMFQLTSLRRMMLAAGTVAAVAAAVVCFTLAYVTVSDANIRQILEWAGLGLRGGAIILTGLALIRFR